MALKPFEKNATAPLASLVDYDKTRPASRVVNENGQGVQILLALAKGMKLDDHSAPADLTVLVVEGEIVFTVGGKAHRLRSGDVLTVEPGKVHNVVAEQDSKILLTKLNVI